MEVIVANFYFYCVCVCVCVCVYVWVIAVPPVSGDPLLLWDSGVYGS